MINAESMINADRMAVARHPVARIAPPAPAIISGLRTPRGCN
jgi:hypothetical protein